MSWEDKIVFSSVFVIHLFLFLTVATQVYFEINFLSVTDPDGEHHTVGD